MSDKQDKKIDINLRCIDYIHDYVEDIPVPIVSKLSGKDFMAYGLNNDMPSIYVNAVDNCSTLGSVVDTITTYVSGAGVTDDREIDKQGKMLSELLESLVFDYVSTGACAVQILRNPYGDIAQLCYVDVTCVRLNEDGTYVYYSKNWGKYNRDIRKYDRWEKGSKSPNSIMYIKNPKSRDIYGVPVWNSSLRDALTMIEASKANYNSILNQFTPNTLISFNSGIPDPETKDQMERSVLEKYTGSNGTKIFMTWCDSADTAPTVQNFSAEDYTEKYNAIMETSKTNILSAFRVSPQLVGIPNNTGFASEEYEDAYKLLYSTQIRPIQDYFEKQFAKLNINFKFNEFKIDFSNPGEQNNNEVNTVE